MKKPLYQLCSTPMGFPLPESKKHNVKILAIFRALQDEEGVQLPLVGTKNALARDLATGKLYARLQHGEGYARVELNQDVAQAALDALRQDELRSSQSSLDGLFGGLEALRTKRAETTIEPPAGTPGDAPTRKPTLPTDTPPKPSFAKVPASA